jgi:putative DNA primase/helicase
VSPILALASPDKRCGKTTTLTLISALVPRPLPAANVTAAGVFRAVEKLRPTLLIDEADTFLGENEGLRGVLNSGHVRTMANVVRVVGDDQDVGLFSTFAPKVIAMIGELPATLTDRAIVIRLRRKQGGERTASLRLDRLADYDIYGRKVARWVHDAGDLIQAADPEVPDGLNDRAADNWRPLLALADTAGGEWPVRARRAALLMSGGEVDPSPGTTLLRDLHGLFTQRDTTSLATTDILDVLTKMEDRPWPEWRRGHPLTPSSLSKLLKPYAIAPKQMRTGAGVVRGYDRADFEEAWARYTPSAVTGASDVYRYAPSNPLHANPLPHNEMTEPCNGVTGGTGSLGNLFDGEAA